MPADKRLLAQLLQKWGLEEWESKVNPGYS